MMLLRSWKSTSGVAQEPRRSKKIFYDFCGFHTKLNRLVDSNRIYLAPLNHLNGQL